MTADLNRSFPLIPNILGLTKRTADILCARLTCLLLVEAPYEENSAKNAGMKNTLVLNITQNS